MGFHSLGHAGEFYLRCRGRRHVRNRRALKALVTPIASALLVLSGLPETSLAASQSQRTLGDIPGARESLSRMVSPKFYRSLQISPIQGWIVVRGQLAAGLVSGARVIHS